MTDYKKLAAYYLKASKKRCVITIIGVMITVIVLYAGLNIFYSYMLQQQKDVRKEADYEIVFLTDDQETLSQIASDDRVTQAYTGKYAVSEWETVNGTDGKYVEKVYDNALYVNTGHPYRMAKIMNEMIEDYGVDAELNWNLSTWYLQDMEEGFDVILIVVLLIAYIFAIFAVGVIRNTIQMFTLEQVKDYGILRCIGATKGQLSGIIYRMGAMLEIAGLLAGIVMGGIVSMILGFIFKISAGFHIIPMIPILITYLGDMYFVMRENAKLVTKMTPVSAVRGEYRIKKEKLRRRGGGLMGKIFGIEGSYARKSVLRNKGRFIKTVTAMVFSISAIVLICSCWGQLRKYWKSTDEKFGDYQINLTSYSSATTSLEEAQSTLPSVEVFRELSRNNVEESKKVYGCKADLVDTDSYTGKITDEFRTKVTMGHYYGVYMDKLNGTGEASDDKDPEVTRSVAETMVNSTDVIGCDDSDLNHLTKYLTAGTTELSENGILVVAGGSFNSWDLMELEDTEDTLYDKSYHFDTYHFELGDTVQLVDFALYQKECLKAKEKIDQEFEKTQKEAGTTGDNDRDGGTVKNAEDRTSVRQEYVEYKKIKDRLIAEGHYKTYKVEGILDLGAQVFGESSDRQIYMRRDDYFDLTGYGENDIAGMKYKVNLDSVSASSVTDMLSYIGDSLYGESMQLCVYLKSFVRYAIAAVLFIFVLSSVNIVNTTAGNLHLRRKEFAQLRVIGMSRKRLLKTVMLEGVMTTVVANVLGFIIGIGLSYGVFMYLNMVIEAGKSIAWWAFGVGLVASGLIICGSIWLGIRDLPVAMVEDLKLEE